MTDGITMQDISKILPVLIISSSLLTMIYVNSNPFYEALAQSLPQQSPISNTVTINLIEGSPNQYDEGSIFYGKVGNIETNITELKGIEAGSGYTYGSAADDTLVVTFPAKVPDQQNPNRMNVSDANIRLDVNSIETKPDGLKIYYAESGFGSNTLGGFEVVEGTLEQTSNEEAIFTLILDQK